MNATIKGVVALALAFVAGVAMSFGQTYTPDALAPFFNSAAPVVAVAGLVAFAGARWWSAALLGALACPALVAGYYVTSELRGFASSTSWVATWATAGVLFGAVMGLAVWLLRNPHGPVLSGLAAAVWPGIAIGEAAHGVVAIADTTPIAYWWTQAAVGVAALAAISWKHLPTWLGRWIAIAATAATAAIIYSAYSLV